MARPSSTLLKRLRGLGKMMALGTLAALYAGPAFAQCSNPAGVEGEIIHNSTHNVPQYCDNTNWIAMIGAEPSVPTGLSLRSSIAPDTTNLEKVEFIKVVGNYAFVSSYTDNHIAAIDVSDPDNPSVEATKVTGLVNVQTFDIVGNTLFVAWEDAGGIQTLSTIDISDPTNMTLLDTQAGSNGVRAQATVVHGNYAYAIANDGTHIWNISDPANITYVGLNTNGTLEGHHNLVHNGIYYALDNDSLCSSRSERPGEPIHWPHELF